MHCPILVLLVYQKRGSEQLTKEIDLAYQESLKADKLKTVTSTEENHNTINLDPGLDVIEKSNTNNKKRLQNYLTKDVKECLRNPVLLRKSLWLQ